jgi:hypothetical protein
MAMLLTSLLHTSHSAGEGREKEEARGATPLSAYILPYGYVNFGCISSLLASDALANYFRSSCLLASQIDA